jgi:hypothetical protein
VAEFAEIQSRGIAGAWSVVILPRPFLKLTEADEDKIASQVPDLIFLPVYLAVVLGLFNREIFGRS